MKIAEQENRQLREQLDVWGKRLKLCSEENDKLHSQLETTLKALKQIANYNYVDDLGRNRRIAKSALAKIGGEI